MRKMEEQLNKKEREETLGRLFTAASAIKNKKQMKQFLAEILTHSEQIMLGRRVWIAQLLLTGHSHEQVCAKLQAGPGTVRRVSKWLEEKLPGYGEAMKEKGRRPRNFNKKDYERIDPHSFKALRRKYPMHFLLFNIAEALIESVKNR
jgi:uncharacterized protein YerC